MRYQVKEMEASIDIPTYLEEYVDIPTFLECCKACSNYGNLWCCPPYDFDVEGYWRKYANLEVYATQILFDKEDVARTYEKSELDQIMEETLGKEKAKLAERMEQKEKEHPGSRALSAGSCILCSKCGRSEGKPCCKPEKMRYSIESLGGNVGKTASKLLGIELVWMEENRLPAYFVLVNGLLLPKGGEA